ncbi:MAG: hypothetical protein B0W54_08135 [Cellvibrio sp. 79]|nr:MAG: hypothetical protein B0W54_08135 [Cellvibrio sp. 79]
MSKELDIIARQIEKAERDLISQRSYGDDDDGMAVLFTGNHHDSFPRYLILNRDLNAIDKVTWQVIRLTITDPTRPGSTPRRNELSAMIGCSAPTLTASRNMLRISRWMTLCKTVRKQGRFVGDIYLLNDEPLSLISTLDFDPTYVRFLESQCQSGNKRLREAAAKALQEIGALETSNPPTESDVFLNRLNRMFVMDEDAAAEPQASDGHQRKNLSLVNDSAETSQNSETYTESVLTNHQSKNSSPVETHQRKNLSPADNDQSRIFTSAEKKISFPGGSSSSFNNNKNISTARAIESEQDQLSLANYLEITRRGRWGTNSDHENAWSNRYLPWLNHAVFERYTMIFTAGRDSCLPAIYRKIKKLPLHGQELVLMQLLGHTAAASHGWREHIRDPIAYTHKLVSLQEADELVPDEWALELIRCYHDKTNSVPPAFTDNPDRSW